ncbi:MAG: MBL fold metallo-hydrolase, partial [Spirochaetales bacterium]
KLRIRGPVNFEDETLEQIIGTQLSYRYWPVRQDELAAKISYESLKETQLDLGDGVKISTKYLNHPVLCLGYRIEYEGKVFATAYDHEPFANLFPTDPAHPDYDAAVAEEGNLAAREENARIESFYRGVDLLVHDTQYTAKEFQAGKQGWGHSSFEYAINAANRCGVKHLLLFHHDPNRGDTELQELELFYQAKLRGRAAMALDAAREGLVVTL